MSKTIAGLDNDRLLDGRYIRRKIIQMKISKTDDDEYRSYSSGSYLLFSQSDINTLDDLITFSSNGLITINYVGLVRINVNVWFNSSNGTARPYMMLRDYSNSETLANAIDDNSSQYVNLTINNFVIHNKTAGTQYGILINCDETVKIDSGSGGSFSYINLEIL